MSGWQIATNNPNVGLTNPEEYRKRLGVRSLRSAEANGDSDVVSVPILYGQRRVPGIVIWEGDVEWLTTKTKLWQWSNSSASYVASVWLALCAGKVELVSVYGNDKELIPGTAYNEPTLFNDGTEAVKPTVLVNTEKVVFVGEDLRTASTFDLDSWSDRTPAGTVLDKNAASYGNKLFVSVGDSNGAKASVHTSTNGTSWTERANTITKDLYGLAYLGGYFIAVGADGVIYETEDGITWTAQTSGVVKDLYAVCSNGSRLVAVGEDGTILSSDDLGDTWDARTSGTAEDLKAVCFGGSLFVAVGTNGAVLTSPDGETWTVESSGITEDLNGVAYGLGKFAAVGVENVLNKASCITSTDGSSWTDMSAYWGSGDLYFIVFNGENFCTQQGSQIFFTQNFIAYTYVAQPCAGYNFYGAVYNSSAASYDYLSKLAGVSHIFFPGDEFDGTDYRVVCDTSGTLPSMAIELRKDLSASPVSDPQLWRVANSVNVKFLGNNPAAVIYDILTNKQFCLGIPAAYIDLVSFNAVAALFSSSESRADERVYGINIFEDGQVNGKVLIDRICQQCDLALYADAGKIYLRSLYDPDGSVQGTVHDDDFKEFSIERQGTADLSNVFIGKFLDAESNYAEVSITLKNEALVSAAGYEKVRRVDLTCFTDRTIAAVRLNEIAQRESVPRSSVRCVVSRRWAHIRPGDLLNVINTEYGISGVYRCVGFQQAQQAAELDITLELEEAREDLYDGNYVDPFAAQGTVPTGSGVTTNTSTSPDLSDPTGVLMPSHGGTGKANADANTLTISEPSILDGILRLTPQASEPANDASHDQIFKLTADPKIVYIKWATDNTVDVLLQIE